jgi:hypothetical protein
MLMPETNGPMPDGFEAALRILTQRLQNCRADREPGLPGKNGIDGRMVADV